MKSQLEGCWQQYGIDSSLPPPRSSTSCGPTEPGRVMEVEPSPVPATPHISSPGQDHHRPPIAAEGSRTPWLQSPPLTQICLKGSGAAAPSLQARFRRFQGTTSQRSKLAAKNGTPLWQGDMLLVLTGGQGTSRALLEGGLDRSLKRGGGTADVSPDRRQKDDPPLQNRCLCTLSQAQPRFPGRADALGAGAPRASPGKPIHPRASEQGLSSPGPFLDQLRWLEEAKQASRLVRMASICTSQALQWL